MKNEPSKLSQLAAIIGSDAWAMSFQSLAQYRTALLREAARLHKEPERLVDGPSGCDSSCCIARPVTSPDGGAL